MIFTRKIILRKIILNTLYTLSISSSPAEICPRTLLNLNALSVLLFTSSLLPVSLSFVLHVVSNIPEFGLSILWNIFWILNIGMYSLLYLKNVDNFSSMTESCSQSFLPLLMKSLSSASIISPERNWEKIKYQNFPENISLTPTSYTTGSFQLYILLEGILNGIRISMPLFLWEDLLKILTSGKWDILMWILLPVNGSTMSSKLFRTENIMTVKLKKKASDTVSKLYREDKRFFFNVGDGDINSTEGIIRYLGRYLARSPVAEYKITEIDDDNVTFFFNDLANNKKKTYITMPAEKFISQILIHLPPKNFKMVNRYGFYSRHISDELKKAMEPFRKNIAVSKYSFYQRQMYITFGMNPFFCPECKIRMIVWEFYHYLYPLLKKYY